MATTQDVLNHHLECFGGGNLDGIMEDYVEDSVLYTPMGVLDNLAAIRELFVGMFAEFGKPGAEFTMDVMEVRGDTAYIVWHAETADNVYELGTDTFVVRDGKIVAQSFAGKIVPKG